MKETIAPLEVVVECPDGRDQTWQNVRSVETEEDGNVVLRVRESGTVGRRDLGWDKTIREVRPQE